MKPGDKVVCVDDQGWLIPERGKSPVKGFVYVVREYSLFGGVGAISLIGFHEYDFYRACRFRPLASSKPRALEKACSGSA